MKLGSKNILLSQFKLSRVCYPWLNPKSMVRENNFLYVTTTGKIGVILRNLIKLLWEEKRWQQSWTLTDWEPQWGEYHKAIGQIHRILGTRMQTPPRTGNETSFRWQHRGTAVVVRYQLESRVRVDIADLRFQAWKQGKIIYSSSATLFSGLSSSYIYTYRQRQRLWSLRKLRFCLPCPPC